MRNLVFAAIVVVAIKEYWMPGYVTAVVVGLTAAGKEIRSEMKKDRQV